jgi:uncharacterized protein (TIGR03086 family)
MELITLHRRAVEHWAAGVAAVENDQWVDPTPCTQWSVRGLVNHVVAEELWTAPLLGGMTIQEVGSQFDGDVLGDDPVDSARIAADEATAIVDAVLPGGGRVQLSYGEEDMGEYVRQLCADHLIHGWDLAAATGGDTSMDPELVAEVGTWFAQREAAYRGSGAIGPRAVGAGDPASDLLAAFGRTWQWGPNHAALARFSVAFGSGEVDAIMARMTDDCVFESTGRHLMGNAMRARLQCERCGRGSSMRPQTRSSPTRMSFCAVTEPASHGDSPGPTTTDRRVTFGASTSCGSATGSCGRSSPTSRAERPLGAAR